MQIIVALDTDSLGQAKKLVKILYPKVKIFKIGLEFINTGQAPELIRFIKNLGGKVFYDIKLNDIPNTVARAAKVISGLGVDMFTIHAASGREAIRAAAVNSGKSKVIGVTVLTSLRARPSQIMSLAKILFEQDVDGVVCSAKEAKMIKLKYPRLKIITPGIRSSWAKTNDQKRSATPKEATKAGADYIVIGRPITNAPDPIRVLNLIKKELD